MYNLLPLFLSLDILYVLYPHFHLMLLFFQSSGLCVQSPSIIPVPGYPLCLVPHLRSLDDRFSYPVVGSFMFLFCLVFAMFCARLFICAFWSPAGKGLTSWLSFVVSSVSLSLSHWYPGSGVVLDCIDS